MHLTLTYSAQSGGRFFTRSNVRGYCFGFNGQVKDNEVYGEGNAYTTDFRELDVRLGRWMSIDPLSSEFPWQSPYCGFDNNPIYFTDPSGAATEGDYYGKDGKHLGSDGEKDNKVYTVDNASDVKFNDNGLVDKLGTTNKEELSITHTQFQMLSGLASKEDYSNKDAIFATANAQANRIELNYLGKGKTFQQGFDSFNKPNAKGYDEGLHGFMKEKRPLYKKYWNSTPALRNTNETFVIGQAAVINAWSVCGYDNTNGATGWQGKDVYIKWKDEANGIMWPAWKEWHTQTGFVWDANPIIGDGALMTPKTMPGVFINGAASYKITASFGGSVYWTLNK